MAVRPSMPHACTCLPECAAHALIPACILLPRQAHPASPWQHRYAIDKAMQAMLPDFSRIWLNTVANNNPTVGEMRGKLVMVLNYPVIEAGKVYGIQASSLYIADTGFYRRSAGAAADLWGLFSEIRKKLADITYPTNGVLSLNQAAMTYASAGGGSWPIDAGQVGPYPGLRPWFVASGATAWWNSLLPRPTAYKNNANPFVDDAETMTGASHQPLTGFTHDAEVRVYDQGGRYMHSLWRFGSC